MAVENQFRLLVERADKFGKAIGVGKELFLGLLEERSDWAFIIQIDALNETAIRETMARLLRVNGVADDEGDKMERFVNALSYQGKSSIIRLLEAAGAPKDVVEYVEAVRKVRNHYAHDIRNLNKSLMDIIEGHNEKSKLFRSLCYISNYDEAGLMDTMRQDVGFLRFNILSQCMVFLLALHQTLGRRGRKRKKKGEA